MSIRKATKIRDRFPGVKNRSGQAAILVGMMSFTFLLFVAFVLNVGMLVNAKINLQNAADMAAYAGAASQARHLNHISFLNYEMRRQYKKFLFRQHVLGTLAYKDAPGIPGAPTAGTRTYDVVAGKPVTCLIFLASDNVCQNTEIRGFKIPSGGLGLDSLQETFKSTVEGFEAARQENCKLASTLNRAAITLWMFNTDPNLKNVADQLDSMGTDATSASASAKRAMQTVQAVGNGLGIYPKEFLLRSRIRTLQSYINEGPKTGVTLEQVDEMKGGPDPMFNERTILAFMSAFKSLGEGTFDNDESITLDEMLPLSGTGADLLGLDPIEIGFDNYHSEFDLIPGANGQGDASKDCVRKLVPTVANLPLPVGFTKQLNKLVYYAVRVSADAKLIFNPFGGTVKLTAYAAAQPFGSRVGPSVISESEFTVEDPSSATGFAGLGDPCAGAGGIGGLSCNNKRSQLTIAGTINFDSYELQVPLAQMAQSGGTVTFSGIKDAEAAVMAPSLSEIGRYNFPNDLPANEMMQKFFDEPQSEVNGKRTYAFWAPILSPVKLATSSKEQAIQEIFTGGAAQTGETASANSTVVQSGKSVSAAFIQAFTDNIGRYIAALDLGQGEGGEGFNIARIVDPFPKENKLPPSMVMTTVAQARTSWNKPRDPDMISAGRVGYSVKLVPLKMLNHAESGAGAQPSTNNSGATWTNILQTPDSSADADLEFIEH
jgi:hypothetical protein